MSLLINGPIEGSGSPRSHDTEVQSSGKTALQPNSLPVTTYSLTRRIIFAVVTCQILLAVGLSLVAVLYARTPLRGTFDTALEGDARSALALVRYTETNPPALMFDSKLLPPSADQAHQDLYEIRAEDG